MPLPAPKDRHEPHHEHLRLQRRVDHRPARRPVDATRQGAADRQYRQRLRLHAAVRRAREAVGGVSRPRPRRRRLPEQPVRLAGPGQQRRDRVVLPAQLRRELPDDGQGRRERRQGASAVAVAHRRGAGAARQPVGQVELHQVPRRPRRQGARPLRADRQARVAAQGHRGRIGGMTTPRRLRRRPPRGAQRSRERPFER